MPLTSLHRKRIVVTRPQSQSDGFIQSLREAGAFPIPFPVIEIGPFTDTTALDRALQKLVCYDWMVLTSVNGVEVVWSRLQALGLGSLPERLRIAAIGPKTAGALRTHGIEPNFVPQEYVAEAILPGLGDLRGRWVLLPRADLARPALAHAIAAADGVAHEIAAYRTLPAAPDPEALQALRNGVDVLTFTSSSTVRNFVSVVQEAGFDPQDLPGHPVVACIGPITAGTARELGFQVGIIAEEYTANGLLKALIEQVQE